MRNLKLLFLPLFLLAMVFAFSSCEKDKDTDPEPPKTNNVDKGIPKSVSIKSVELLKWPSGSYDVGSEADLYLSFGVGSIAREADRVTNITTDIYHRSEPSWLFSPPKTITQMNTDYYFASFDYDDGDPDDFIGGVVFKATDLANFGVYPDYYTLSNNDYSVNVGLVWNY